MEIQWYPGHMGKAHEQMSDLMRRIDIVVEIVDARLPASSSNHQLEELRRAKPCIKVLNKQDLADPIVTKAWVGHFERESGVRALPLSAKQQADGKQLIKLVQRLVPNRGKPGWPIRAMVAGIPNVGKSTLINTLAGRSLAKVGDKPAITTCNQQIDLHNGIMLYDTPGLLWPDLDDQAGAYRLATTGPLARTRLKPILLLSLSSQWITWQSATRSCLRGATRACRVAGKQYGGNRGNRTLSRLSCKRRQD